MLSVMQCRERRGVSVVLAVTGQLKSFVDSSLRRVASHRHRIWLRRGRDAIGPRHVTLAWPGLAWTANGTEAQDQSGLGVKGILM